MKKDFTKIESRLIYGSFWDRREGNHERVHREPSRKVTKNVKYVDLGLSIPP